MKTSARINLLCSHYSDIAIENYFSAKDTLAQIKEKNDICYCLENFNKVYFPTIITRVFSIMAVESFFNNYAAENLGDEEFYANFDKLSLISKFQLISMFILQTEIDKSKSYYGNLKAAENMRNELVHNKSKDLIKWATTQNIGLDKESNDFDFDEEKSLKLSVIELNNEIQNAKTAIKCMRDIALFFEKNDENSFALRRLFPQISRLPKSDLEQKIIKEFSIKI